MVRLASLEDMNAAMQAEGTRPSRERLNDLLADPDAERRVRGILLDACASFRDGDEPAALRRLRRARTELSFIPTILIHNIVWLADRLGRRQEAAHECLAFADDAVRMGYADLALEAAAAALILDAQAEFEITRDPARGARVARLYETVAQTLRTRPDPAGAIAAAAPARRRALRVALVVPNIVDDVVAYTKRLLHFARHADPARFALRVYSSENHAGRDTPLFPTGCALAPSAERGRRTIAELGRRRVPVWLGSTAPHFTGAARELAARLEQDGVDILILQAGLSTPIDWLAARLARVPVKLAIHIGSSLFMPGLDGTFFDNPANIEREAAWWPADGGERILLPKGVDIAELDGQAPWPRSRLGIPERAVVLGTLSNHLDRRLSPEYMGVVASVLRANPDAWFLALGADPIPEKEAFFREAGVGDRVRFGGRVQESGAALKTLDIYASEFPVGGSQSVMEAMACARPVAALRWSDAHAESVGAELVGAPPAVPTRDLAAYEAVLNAWGRDPEARREAGQAMRRRAETRFSAATYVRAVLDKAAESLAGKEHGGCPYGT